MPTKLLFEQGLLTNVDRNWYFRFRFRFWTKHRPVNLLLLVEQNNLRIFYLYSVTTPGYCNLCRASPAGLRLPCVWLVILGHAQRFVSTSSLHTNFTGEFFMRCFQCQGQKQKSSQSGYSSHFIFKRTQGLAEFLLAYLLFTHWSAVAYSFSDVETINFTTAKWCCSECFKQRGCPTCLMSQTELLSISTHLGFYVLRVTWLMFRCLHQGNA